MSPHQLTLRKFMSKLLTQHLNRLSDQEREELNRRAADAGMTVEDWIAFSHKAQIYRNAEEVLKIRKEAA